MNKYLSELTTLHPDTPKPIELEQSRALLQALTDSATTNQPVLTHTVQRPLELSPGIYATTWEAYRKAVASRQTNPTAAPPARVDHARAANIHLPGLKTLQTIYPVLRRFMDEDVFDFFAKAYLWENNHQSPGSTSVWYHFPEFLGKNTPQQMGPTDSIWLLPREIARFERARTEIMQSPDSSPAKPTLLAQVANHSRLLRLPTNVRILRLHHPLASFWQMLEQTGQLPPLPTPRRSLVAMARVRGQMKTYELTEWQFSILSALTHTKTLDDVVTLFPSSAQPRDSQTQQEVMDWLPIAEQQGLIAAVRE